MQFRSLLLMGLCAVIGMATPALAETAKASSKTYLFGSRASASDDDGGKAKADQKNPKKKLTAKEKAKADAKLSAKAKAEARQAAKEKAAAEKLAAKEKADAAKKLAAKAKADADKKLAIAKAREDAKIEKAKIAEAKAKAAKDARLAKAKLAEEAKAARLKALEEVKVAKAKAAEESKRAKAQAAEDARIARARADEQRRIAAEEARVAELRQYAALAIATEGNNGELRSESVETKPQQAGFFQALFGGKQQQQANLLPETRALDSALELKQGKNKFRVKPEYEPQSVTFPGYERGTIVIDTAAHFLYLVESPMSARRYGIAVGRDGLQYKGTVRVGDKQEWPRWIPTLDMQKREPKKYGQYKDGMPGGGQNPLGARAIYLYEGKKDTHLRIHGTIAPETIGTNSSNGCFRMVNEHVMDLYKRVKIGTNVIVL